jgi:hypothetical protein
MEDFSYNQQLVDGGRAETYNRDVMYHDSPPNFIKKYIHRVFLVVAFGIISSASQC